MAKKRLFDDIAEGLHEAIALAEGKADPSTYRIHVPADVDVKTIRKKVGLTQLEFAAQFGFNPARVRDWEQGRSHPDGAVRAYLMVIDRKPDAVREALQAAPVKKSRAQESRFARAS
ncbi:MAG TPA: helix-turn-helix domain-containing protein [Micropepsaceae bacterium]|jgi:putative transcriptional regulator|nr:helix-turn-helix domain-containing protein [Micropepsaceae bacterium]